MGTYAYPKYTYSRPAELDQADHKQVVIVGGGLVGLTMALDLAKRGIGSTIFDDDDTVSVGSRSICQAKRTLEIWDRLGVAAPMMEKGVTWNEGHVFYRDEKLYEFNLQDNPDSKFPAFINLQQYYCEEFLVDACAATGLVDLRWCHKVTGISQGGNQATVTVETPDGVFSQTCDWLIAADGARSEVRRQMGLEFDGQVFEDHFLIADVIMESDLPPVRRFWFDPVWGPEQSALMHQQADNVWRLDFQLGWDIDKAEEMKEENVIPRVKRMIGDDTPFEFEWVSIYTFQCRTLDKYRHGRVLFIGDAAHQVSPFGARGGNGGVQDVDNLGWKLAAVLKGDADEALIDTYDAERKAGADENILNSTRATDFITPKTPVSEVFRDAVLELARDHAFARSFVNSGRLSLPKHLDQSPLNGADIAEDGIRPGSPVPAYRLADAADGGATHMIDLLGDKFAIVIAGGEVDLATMSDDMGAKILVLGRNLPDPDGRLQAGFGLPDGGCALIRPDQHVAARWNQVNTVQIKQTMQNILQPVAG